jgi:hypothetical protein
MEHNKSTGPDGFPAEFYQVFWEIIKYDIMVLFNDFYKRDLLLYNLNFGTIVLIPKCKDASKNLAIHVNMFAKCQLQNIH